MVIHYLEIVSNDVDALIGLYQRMHGLSFGTPDPDLGQARVATQPTERRHPRTPAAHEHPTCGPTSRSKTSNKRCGTHRTPARRLLSPHPPRVPGHLCNRDPVRCGTWTLATLTRRLC